MVEVPAILVNTRQLREVVDDAWRALLASSYGERLFRYGGAFVFAPEEVRNEEHFQVVDQGLLAWMLNRSASWLRVNADGEERDTRLPTDVVKDMLAGPDDRIPHLDGVVRVPILRRDGTLGESRYEAAYRLLQVVRPEELSEIRRLPIAPSESDRASALSLILGELLRDFPFARASDRAHAVAALLLPVVRHFIDGPTPLYLIEAPTEGTGKSLLADIVHLVATGKRAHPTPLPTREEELRKKLTALLLTAPTLVLFDNVNHPIDSASLAAVLSSQSWSDRLLGQSRQLWLPNRVMWIATANNPVLSREVSRRVVRIRLDARVERPWLRDGFRHTDLGQWLLSHRAEVVGALMTLVRSWIVAGTPFQRSRIGTFESWSAVLGGILQVAGVQGFLEDRRENRALLDPMEADWISLVELWRARFGSRPQLARSLLELAQSQRLLCLDPADLGSSRQRAKFARDLAGRRDRVYGSWRIDVSRDRKRKQNVYALLPEG